MNAEQNQARTDVTMAIMALLDEWSLNSAQMQVVLSLPESVRTRAFNKYRDGNDCLPDDPAVLRRARYLLGIADALRTTYPCNPKMGGRWIRQPQRRYGRRTPLSIILEDGEQGLVAMLAQLDCTFSWDQSGSQNTSVHN